MKCLGKHPAHLLSLGFCVGLVPFAPGTMGTVVGVIFYIYLQHLPLAWYALTILTLFILGVWSCGITAHAMGTHDHPAIVWDEIVGFLITMTAAPTGWDWILLGFIFFRVFDIAKPWPIRFIDTHIQGGFGIMLDDLLAGIYGLGSLRCVEFVML